MIDITKNIIDLIKLSLGLKISFIFLIFDVLFKSFRPELITNQKVYCYIFALFCISVIFVNIICISYEKYRKKKEVKEYREKYPEIEKYPKLKMKVELKNLELYKKAQQDLEEMQNNLG